MTTLYVLEPFSTVKKDAETLVVHVPENKTTGQAACKVVVPLNKITEVVVQGNSTLTTPALLALLENHAPVTFLSAYGTFAGRLTPEFSKNSLVRVEQHRAHHQPPRALAVARACVAGKLANQRTLLLRTNRKRQLPQVAKAANRIKAALDEVHALDPAQATVPNPAQPQANSLLGRLQGLEGAAGAAYFGAFGALLVGGWVFDGRARRPPTDPVNALLSYAYTLLMHQVLGGLGVVGLDPYVGYLHSAQFGKPALALDLMEEFRPIVADSLVLTVLNNAMLKPDDFEAELGAYRMTERARRIFLGKWEERLTTEIEHPVFGYKVTYRRCIELQARLLAKWLTGEIPHYVPFEVR